MDEKIYTVTLADGTELSGLRLNGNNFISEAEISADIFAGNCSSVTINDGETEDTHENMELIHVTQMGDEFWFALRDLSAAELARMRMEANIEKAGAAAAITFVTLAEAGDIDDVTAGEHAELFSPWAAGVSYETGNIRVFDGRLYRCIQAHTSQEHWTPDAAASLWVKIADPAEEWPEWNQPIGAHDAYNAGDKVSHGGQHWVSDVDGNVWEPGVYGWSESK